MNWYACSRSSRPEKRKLLWAKVCSGSCENRMDGANKVFDSALNGVTTGATGFCTGASRSADICTAAAWLLINIPSSRIRLWCITKFLVRLILAFHRKGEGTDFAPASKFLSLAPLDCGSGTSLCEEPDC